MSRKYTNKLWEMLNSGFLNQESVIIACLNYMSEDDVKDMMEHNEFIDTENDKEE